MKTEDSVRETSLPGIYRVTLSVKVPRKVKDDETSCGFIDDYSIDVLVKLHYLGELQTLFDCSKVKEIVLLRNYHDIQCLEEELNWNGLVYFIADVTLLGVLFEEDRIWIER